MSNKRGEQANNKKHFLEAGKPKISEDGLIDIAAEIKAVNSSARNTLGIKDFPSMMENNSPLCFPN